MPHQVECANQRLLDEPLLRFLCGLSVPQVHVERHCALSTVPSCLGSHFEVECCAFIGPCLNLGLLYASLVARGLTLDLLLSLPREDVEKLARDLKLLPAQHARLAAALPLYSETQPHDLVNAHTASLASIGGRGAVITRNMGDGVAAVVTKMDNPASYRALIRQVVGRVGRSGPRVAAPAPPPVATSASSGAQLRLCSADDLMLRRSRSGGGREVPCCSAVPPTPVVADPFAAAGLSRFSPLHPDVLCCLSKACVRVDQEPVITRGKISEIVAVARGDPVAAECVWDAVVTPRTGALAAPRASKRLVANDLSSIAMPLQEFLERFHARWHNHAAFFRTIFRRITLSSPWFALLDELPECRPRLTSEQAEAAERAFGVAGLSVLTFDDFVTRMCEDIAELLAPFLGLMFCSGELTQSEVPSAPKRKLKKRRTVQEKQQRSTPRARR